MDLSLNPDPDLLKEYLLIVCSKNVKFHTMLAVQYVSQNIAMVVDF